MKILISNDDGVHAPGIHALAEEFAQIGDAYIVAPEREKSTTGHSLTLHKPLRIHKYSPRIFSVSGSPADCIYLGIHSVLKGRPDLILSGINRGANLGQDVFLSGTVSAAREGANLEIPSMSISLNLDFFKANKEAHYESAAKAARKVFDLVLSSFGKKNQSIKSALKQWPKGTLMNVNVPNVSYQKLKGYRAATQGKRIYGSQIVRRKDARGRDYFWIGGKYEGYKLIKNSDCWLVDHNYVAITPLEMDTTMTEVHAFLKEQIG